MSRLVNQRTGATIATDIRLAGNPWTRAVGLLGKKTLPDGQGLLIRPSWSIHTWFMRFPLDVIFVDRGNVVTKVSRNMGAFRMAASRGAHAVIELRAGTLSEDDVREGDQLSLVEE